MKIGSKRLGGPGLRNADGAVDLASIMVGVLVAGAVAGIIAAVVFAVIPWAQDRAAKAQLDAVHSAESVTYAQSTESGAAKYQTAKGLSDYGLLQENVYVKVIAGDNCYFTSSTSKTGRTFWADSSSREIREGGTSTCVEAVTEDRDALVAAEVQRVGSQIVAYMKVTGGQLPPEIFNDPDRGQHEVPGGTVTDRDLRTYVTVAAFKTNDDETQETWSANGGSWIIQGNWGNSRDWDANYYALTFSGVTAESWEDSTGFYPIGG
ncbi:hypothetical protein SAMN05216368_10922 [Cryobacterium flavum]|uniref:Uncharacterized protein n=1 Tax=Cryobacterium flavum TaxID=1424659 RepID=A0A4R8V4T3_9MICO|nr:hypothetical protein [Cryobacterium flavum]TFB76100.1 hypothetical protein E3O21_11640 [Cryobacterium flavum]SDO00510.1 hypothetical protein SAMN05216368_10922 [Cryobacterium flavum]